MDETGSRRAAGSSPALGDAPHPQAPSVAEEIANSVTHGVGALGAAVGLPLLVTLAALRGDARHVATSAVFGVTLLLLYLASTLYHAVRAERTKRVLRLLDHCAIFLLIAGTYTPFTVVSLGGGWGWGLFVTVWTLALAGVVLKVARLGRHPILSLVLYLGMGWLVAVALGPLSRVVPPAGLALLLAGGLAYTAGVAFFVCKRLRFSHAVWHLFVLAGSVLHFLAVLLYVIPRPPTG